MWGNNLGGRRVCVRGQNHSTRLSWARWEPTVPFFFFVYGQGVSFVTFMLPPISLMATQRIGEFSHSAMIGKS